MFNRLLGHRAAVVDDRPGVTRDRHFQEWEFDGRRVDLVDTGGFIDETLDPLADQVRHQIDLALNAADVVLFMIDARTGITYDDLQLARSVQRLKKDVLLLANKAERPQDREAMSEWMRLGLGPANPVSATMGYGIDGLLERLRKLVPPTPYVPEYGRLRIGILGRPNAGKSTLVNRLLGEDRMIVSDVPGTTRDSVDAGFVWEGHSFVVTDTAGLRKKARVHDDVEYYSNMRSLESIRRSHVVVLLVDSLEEGLPEQDLRILRQVEEAGKGLVLGLSKWDALDKDHKTFDILVKEMRSRIPALAETPIVAFSGKTGQRVPRLLEEVLRVRTGCLKVLGRENVIKYFDDCLDTQKPPHAHGHPIVLDRCCQVHVDPPMLAFETENPDLVAESYRRFLRARAIERFGLAGVPLRIAFRKKLELRTDEDLLRYGGDTPMTRAPLPRPPKPFVAPVSDEADEGPVQDPAKSGKKRPGPRKKVEPAPASAPRRPKSEKPKSLKPDRSSKVVKARKPPKPPKGRQ